METSAGKKLDDFMWPDKGKTNYNFLTQRGMQTYKLGWRKMGFIYVVSFF